MATGGLGGGGANAVKQVTLIGGVIRNYGYDASGNMTADDNAANQFAAKYDHTNLATKLQRGAVINYFTYGPNNVKARQTGSDGSKVYLGGYEDWITAGQTKVSLGNYAQITNGTGGRVLHYFLTDRLGSVDAVTDGNGNLIETRGYDAFGAPRTGVWADASQIASTAITPKGFTSHEHLNNVQLIHMNGRMYDFQLGRFLGVDPFIQAPTNSQSLNPYSYIMNNPLSGTDPTGYASCTGKDDPADCTPVTETRREAPIGSRIKSNVVTTTTTANSSESTTTNNFGHVTSITTTTFNGAKRQGINASNSNEEKSSGNKQGARRGNVTHKPNAADKKQFADDAERARSETVNQLMQKHLEELNSPSRHGPNYSYAWDLLAVATDLKAAKLYFQLDQTEFDGKLGVVAAAGKENGDPFVVFFRGAWDAYVDGAEPAKHYLLLTSPGYEGLLNTMTHESFHFLKRLNYYTNKRGIEDKLPSKIMEPRAEHWVLNLRGDRFNEK